MSSTFPSLVSAKQNSYSSRLSPLREYRLVAFTLCGVLKMDSISEIPL